MQRVSTNTLDLAQCDITAFEERVEKMLSGGDGKAKGDRALQHPLQANSYNLRSMDGALAFTVGAGLAKWKVVESVGVLKETESRFFVPADELPEHASLGRVGRCCVLDSATGRTRFEVMWSLPRPVLFVWRDQCKVGLAAGHLKFYIWKLRGDSLSDPPHRRMNNILNAYKKSRVKFVRDEWLVVCSYYKGPFGSQANQCRLGEAAAEYFANFDHTEKCYVFLYEVPCWHYYRGNYPAEFGSVEHQQEFFDIVKGFKIYTNTGALPKSGRWGQFEERSNALHPEAGGVLLICTYQSVVKEKLTTLSSVPFLFGISSGQAVQLPVVMTGAGGGVAAGEAEDRSKAVATSGEELQKLRRHCPDTRSLIMNILFNTTTTKLKSILVHMTEPALVEHKRTIVELETQRSCYEWHIQQALGKNNDYLQKVWAKMRDRAVLLEIGFKAAEDIFTEAVVKEDRLLAETMFDVGFHLVSQESLCQQYYSHRPPFVFLGALSRDENDQKMTMNFCRRLWDEVVDWAAGENGNLIVIKEWLQVMHWPHNPWCMEMLVAAKENDFKKFPAAQEKELHDLARGPGSSVLAEWAHKSVNGTTKHSPNNTMSRVGKMYNLIASGLMEDTDRPQVPQI